MIYAGVALCILLGVALWLYTSNARRTAEHVNAELAAPPYDSWRPAQLVAPPMPMPMPEIISESPAGTMRSIQADVAVPALHSLCTGAIGALLGLSVAALFSWALWRLALAGFVVGLAADWLLSWHDARRLLWKIEKIGGQSSGGDLGGQSLDTGHMLLINPDQARGQAKAAQAQTARRIMTRDLLKFWAGCHSAGTSLRAHGIAAGSGAEFDRYNEMRDILMRLGLAEWNNPASHTAGWRVIGDMAKGSLLISQHVRDQRDLT